MSCGVGHIWVSDLAFLWRWYRLVATALTHPLTWEFPHAVGMALKSKKKKKVKNRKRKLLPMRGGTSLRHDLVPHFTGSKI